MQHRVFSVGVRLVGGGLVLRDQWLGRIKPGRGVGISERVRIASGRRWMDAVWVRPEAGVELRGAVLICHGIGEVVEHWARAQELLAEHGLASLVFNYSGCGQSRGKLSAHRCERDAQAAFWWMHERLPGVEVTLLGFSLGSGVATAVAGQIPVSRLVLCEAYTSFREAVRSLGAPAWVSGAVPDVWRTEEALRGCKVPVLVLHGERDGLFPVSMAERLARAAGERGELVLVEGMGHADLHAEARSGDWQPILERLCRVQDRIGMSEIKA